MPKPQYTQKFRAAWLKDPELKDWLTEVSSTSGSIAKCKVCHCTLNTKYSDLKMHSLSKKHKVNCNIVLGSKQPKIAFAKETSLNSSKKAECKLAVFVACHTAILNTDHLTSVCRSSFECK